MDIAITTMSSKGQIVVPTEMRKDIKEGEKLFIIKKDHQFIMKRARDLDANFKEDLEFAKLTEEAWQRHDKGEFKSSSTDDFLKELKKW